MPFHFTTRRICENIAKCLEIQQVNVELKNPPTAGYTYYLQMVVVEDSVLDWQTNGGTSVQYFVHHFVLRSAINGPWGDAITFSGANTPVTKYYTFNSSKLTWLRDFISGLVRRAYLEYDKSMHLTQHPLINELIFSPALFIRTTLSEPN